MSLRSIRCEVYTPGEALLQNAFSGSGTAWPGQLQKACPLLHTVENKDHFCPSLQAT